MPSCSTHVHHRPTFPIQFLPDPRIYLVNTLPMAQPLLPNTGYTRGTKTKDAFLSVTIQFRGLVSLTWMAHVNTCSYIDGTTVTTITLPFGLWLNTRYSVIRRLWRKMAGQNCSWQEMPRRNSAKEEKFHENNPSHVLQTVLLSLLLAHGQAQTKPESVYSFPRNSIVPTSWQWRKKRNSCSGMWASPRVMILVRGIVRGVPKIITFCPVKWKLLSRCGGVFVSEAKPLQGPRIMNWSIPKGGRGGGGAGIFWRHHSAEMIRWTFLKLQNP